MCGIASFLSNRHWSGIPDTQWLTDLAASFDAAVAGNDLMDASTPLDDLAAHFYDSWLLACTCRALPTRSKCTAFRHSGQHQKPAQRSCGQAGTGTAHR